MNPDTQLPFVSTYYGTTLKSQADLKTSACCPITSVPPTHRPILSKLHPDVTTRFYGCGSPIPDALSGTTILDLGCGTGRDAFLASALAGPTGRVIGVDMTDEQLAIARQHQRYHADALLGPGAPINTDFRKGFIEDLTSANIEHHSIDVVISNCVCNLSPNKKAVFAEVARVLREGGELYFSDVYADRRLSEHARAHPVLVAECLGGALYFEDFRRIMAEVGLVDLRVVASGPIVVHDKELAALVPDVNFYSITIRAFNIASLEDRRENYGQFATFNSSFSNEFHLDVDHIFPKGTAVPVDANTAAILQNSRFSNNFTVTSRGPHHGLFSAELEGGAIGTMINSTKARADSCCPATAKPPAISCCNPSPADKLALSNPPVATCPPNPAQNDEQEQAKSPCCQPQPAQCSKKGQTSKECMPSEVIEKPVSAAEVKVNGCNRTGACC